MGLTASDVLAIRATMLNVSRVRRDVAVIGRDLRYLRQENARSASAMRSVASAVSRTYDVAARSSGRAITQTRALNREAQRLRGTFSSLRGMITSIGLPLGIAGVGRLGLGAIKAFEGKAGSQRAFAYNFGQTIGRGVMAELDRFADVQGLSRRGTRQTGLSIAGSRNVRPADLMPIIRGYSALGAVGGANSEQMNRAFEQLAQIASQGQLQGDEVRQIAENLVPLRSLLIQAGLGGRLGSQTDPISWKEVADVLIKFGKSGDVNAMLAAQAANATSSLQRLYNIVEDDLAPVIGEVLSPALTEVATNAANWAKSIDPEDVKRRTKQFLAAGKAIVDYAPAILGVYIGAKLAQLRLGSSAYGAAAALDVLAESAYFAAGRGGGMGAGGYGGGASAGGRGAGGVSALPRSSAGGASPVGVLYGPNGTKAFVTPKASGGKPSRLRGAASAFGRGAKAVGRTAVGGVGAVGGAMAGQKVGEAITDNPIVQTILSIAGSIGGAALAGKVMAAISGGGAGAAASGAAATGGTAVGASALGVGGLALGLGMLAEAALIGHMEGALYGYGDERTVAYKFMKRFVHPDQKFGAGAKGAGNRDAILRAARIRREAGSFLGKKMPWMRGKNGALNAQTLLDYAWMLPVHLQQQLAEVMGPQWRAAYAAAHSGSPSPRAAAYDTKASEDNSRSIRWTY